MKFCELCFFKLEFQIVRLFIQGHLREKREKSTKALGMFYFRDISSRPSPYLFKLKSL